jgi:serine protease Do
MQCPKCGHDQLGRQECESCGIIFAKYLQVQKRKREAELSAKEKSSSGLTLGKVFQVIMLVVAVAGTTYYFTADQNKNGGEPIYPSELTDVPAIAKISPGALQADKAIQGSTEKKAASSAKLPILSAQNAIEQARQATVTVETPWGTGSGFFVNDNYIVTNRHVIQFDTTKLTDFKTKIEKARRMIELERQKIQEMKQKFRQLPKGPTRSQLAIIIETREEELAKVLPKYEKSEKKLVELEDKASAGDIKIILSDGSEHIANYFVISENYDLALMSLFVQDGASIKRPEAGSKLRQGDKVYTIGSPVGLRQTVTSGIFSGYRTHEPDGAVYLQTDAAINPGNSGGPLIDEHGYVRGVNTMILKNTEGIGFAIPIDVVFEEFSSSFY